MDVITGMNRAAAQRIAAPKVAIVSGTSNGDMSKLVAPVYLTLSIDKFFITLIIAIIIYQVTYCYLKSNKEATKMRKMYRITRGSQGGYYDYACQQMCGLYQTLDSAREQIPDDWVRDDETDPDRDGEAYYRPETAEDEFDGYGVLVTIMVEMVEEEDLEECGELAHLVRD